MPLTGVTFDLWQTLIVDKPELGRGRMKVRIDGTISALDEIGIRLSLEQVNEAYRRCSRACQKIRAQERDISFMEQIRVFYTLHRPESDRSVGIKSGTENCHRLC